MLVAGLLAIGSRPHLRATGLCLGRMEGRSTPRRLSACALASNLSGALLAAAVPIAVGGLLLLGVSPLVPGLLCFAPALGAAWLLVPLGGGAVAAASPLRRGCLLRAVLLVLAVACLCWWALAAVWRHRGGVVLLLVRRAASLAGGRCCCGCGGLFTGFCSRCGLWLCGCCQRRGVATGGRLLPGVFCLCLLCFFVCCRLWVCVFRRPVLATQLERRCRRVRLLRLHRRCLLWLLRLRRRRCSGR